MKCSQCGTDRAEKWYLSDGEPWCEGCKDDYDVRMLTLMPEQFRYDTETDRLVRR